MEDMSASYGNVGPGGPANVHYPQKARRQESVNSTRPSWMQPTLLQENALQPTRTRDATSPTSQLAKSNSELDWLGQGTSDAAGKNPVPIKRPDRGTQNETHVGPFGPSNASISAKAHSTAPANRQNPDIPQKNPPSTFQPVGGTNDQGQTLSGADHSTTNFTPFSPSKNHHGKPDDVTPNNIRPKPFDAVHDPSDPSKKDIIFRMSMPIVEDFQPGLDEFCRLRRLGHFEDAEQQFQYTLKNLQGMPYVLVQYCEMLLAAGRYTSFRAVSYRKKYASLESEESVKDHCLDMLEGNFWLLDRLAKVPLPAFSVDIFEAINETLMALRSESAMGSTAIQILVLCLTILGHLRVSLGDSVTGRINYYDAVLDWNQLYHRLLGENRIWDLRDLLVAAGSLFGPQFLTKCLDVKSFSLALDRLLEDWMQPEYDESTNLGLLDLFTSLLLDGPSSIKDDPKAALLLEHAKSLAESIQVNDTQNMRSRPFIQWIMAKVVSEMGGIPIRPDGLRVEDFSGITIFPRPGAHLPVYIPAEPWDKPHWDMFSVRSSPQQRQALQTALQAARSIGDYRLQATCLKILILHSQEPKSLMDLLATLQFEQGDTEGFLGTCLSKYIVLSSEDEASRLELIAEFEKLRTILPNKPGDTHPEPASCPPGVYYSNSICAPRAFLLWARDVITKVLADNADRDGGKNNFLKNKVEFWNGQLVNYGSRLPLTMANHIREKYQVQVPPHIQLPPIQLPLPPVAAQMPPPQAPPAPSTIPAEAAFFEIPPNPQIPQRGQVGFLRTMADPGSTVDPYRAAVSYGADPFALPATSQPSQRQTDQPGQATFSPPNSSNSYGDGLESSFSLTDDYSDSEDLGFQYPELDPIDSASNLLDYAPPPRHLRRIPLERDKIKMRDKTHSSHQRPVRRKNRTHDSNRKDSSHAINGSEFGITSTMSSSTMSSSGVGRETGDRPQKNKPEAPVLFDSEDLGFHYPELEDSDDGENDKRTMSPYIKVSREGKKQNLKITSDLSEQHDISIVMTNKTDATRSRVYTVKNGAVWEETATDPAGNDPSGERGEGSETLDGIPISSTRPRTESRSSQQTVRPLKASILREGSSPLCTTSALAGPSTSIQEGGSTVDDKSSRVRAQVDKANEYMDRNTVRWLDRNRTDDAPSSSKPRQPSIAEPKLRNPAAPGNLVDAISADEYAHEDRAQTERTKEPRLLQRQKHQQPQRSKRDKRYHSFVISEDTGLQSDETVQLSDSASASPDDDDDEMDSEPSQSIAKPSSLCYSI